jgi:hypothetical protein
MELECATRRTLHEDSILAVRDGEREIRERINQKLAHKWVREGHGFSRAAQS